MDNPTRWNITNSAQNIVSALVDPSKQFDGVFRREWATTFAGFSRYKLSEKHKVDLELKNRLDDYLKRLENRKQIKAYEEQQKLKETSESGSSVIGPSIAVPSLYMSEDFDLSNQEIFICIVTTGGKNGTSFTDHNDLSTYHIDQWQQSDLMSKNRLREQQQILTDYLDVIEENLASQISSRSGDFFQVMSSVDSVMDELSLAIKSVTNLRKKCAKLSTSLIAPNMKCIQINKKRDNASALLNKLNEIAYLCKVQPMIQVLLAASDFVGALDLISKSRIMLHKDLTHVVCLRHLESQLNEIERMIGTMMQQEFLTLISSEWDGSINQQNSAASRLSKLFEYYAKDNPKETSEGDSLTLLSLLQIQAEKFVNQFHEERKKRVESTLDIEQWKVVEVPSDFQRLISMIVDEKIAIHEIFSGENMHQLSLSRNSSETHVDNMINGKRDADGTISNERAPQTSKNASNDNLKSSEIEAEKKTNLSQRPCIVKASGSDYVIVNSVINLVRTIMDYCKCAHDIRSLSTDLLERLFKILLLYNTKTYHLVFSAGAIQVAGLKTITTRVLIVSQRSLRLITLLIPSIQRHFCRLLPENENRLKRFEEITALYEEHAAKIPERVKTLISEIVNLQMQDWDAKPPVPSRHFSSVIQHLTRLHENIHDALPHNELRTLFIELNNMFKDILLRHLKRLRIGSDAGPQRWLVTQELTFYKIALTKLGALSNIQIEFDDIWLRLNDSQIDETSDCDDR